VVGLTVRSMVTVAPRRQPAMRPTQAHLLTAPAPGTVIQHMCIEPVFIFFICKTSDAPAAASDQKIRKRSKTSQYTAVYCSILDAARVPPPYSLLSLAAHTKYTQTPSRKQSLTTCGLATCGSALCLAAAAGAGA